MPGPQLASVDGSVGPASDATVSITDDGLLRGDGAFEVARLYGGRAFGLGEHLDRLRRSSEAIELEFDRVQLEREIEALLEANAGEEGQLRIVVTRGGRRIAICEPLPPFAESVAIATVTYSPSVILTGAKTLSYGANMQATRMAKRQGADEALLVRPDGIVLEAPTSTIFWADADGRLHTPSIETGILRSITRRAVVEALDVAEGEYEVGDVASASEAFLASSAREIQSISSVDGKAIDAPGPRTAEAAEALRAAIQAERVDGLGPIGSRRVDLELTDEQRLIAETARDFTDKEIIPKARDSDREGRFDRELAGRLGEMGYLGAILDEEYGGRSLDYVTYGLIVEQVGRGDSAMRTVVSVQTSLVGGSLERWGTEEQKKRWLPPLCSGESLGCFGLTEPDSGSDAASLRTRAERTSEGWRINGQKMWISFGNYADFALIFAQTDFELKHRGLACFVVPTDSPGYSAQEIHGKLGLRASDTASISLDDVEVGEDALLGEVGDGFKVAMSALDSGRYSVAAGCVGICDGCVDASVTYSTERQQFGVPIARFQLVQELIADMIVKRDAARMLVRRAGILKDAGKPNTVETSVAKLYATEAAVECANSAIQVHGGAGYVDDHPVERYLRDARVTTLYEGTSQVQKLIIGRDATGISAFLPYESSQEG